MTTSVIQASPLIRRNRGCAWRDFVTFDSITWWCSRLCVASWCLWPHYLVTLFCLITINFALTKNSALSAVHWWIYSKLKLKISAFFLVSAGWDGCFLPRFPHWLDRVHWDVDRNWMQKEVAWLLNLCLQTKYMSPEHQRTALPVQSQSPRPLLCEAFLHNCS